MNGKKKKMKQSELKWIIRPQKTNVEYWQIENIKLFSLDQKSLIKTSKYSDFLFDDVKQFIKA